MQNAESAAVVHSDAFRAAVVRSLSRHTIGGLLARRRVLAAAAGREDAQPNGDGLYLHILRADVYPGRVRLTALLMGCNERTCHCDALEEFTADVAWQGHDLECSDWWGELRGPLTRESRGGCGELDIEFRNVESSIHFHDARYC